MLRILRVMKNTVGKMNIEDFADKTLLIVDDDDPFRNRLGRAMESKGFKVSLAKSVHQTSDLKQIQAIISAGEVKISEAQLRNLTEKEREYFDTDEYQIAANLKKLTTFSCYDFIDQNLMPMPDHSKIPGEFKEETTVQFVQLNQPVKIIAEDDIEFVLINNA